MEHICIHIMQVSCCLKYHMMHVCCWLNCAPKERSSVSLHRPNCAPKNAAAQTGRHQGNRCKEDQALRGGKRTLWRFERAPCLMHKNAKKTQIKMTQTVGISPCPVAARPPPAPARSWRWHSQEWQLSPSQRFVMGRDQAKCVHDHH